MKAERESHQPLGHGSLVLSRKVLLQRQDDAVGDDGGEDHVLKWSGGQELRRILNLRNTEHTWMQ